MSVTKIQLGKVIERLYDQHMQDWYSVLNTSSKLGTYGNIKTSFNFEKYLDIVSIDKYRHALCRLRCSAHKLAIEEGRFKNIIRVNRKCNLCNMNMIEDETYDFVLVCPFYTELRKTWLPKYYCR